MDNYDVTEDDLACQLCGQEECECAEIIFGVGNSGQSCDD